jgi:hypothetical protein
MIVQGTVTEKALATSPFQLPPNLGAPGVGIPFISVKLVGTPPLQNYNDTTDAEGKFKFEVPQGSYTLQVRSPIHQPKSEVVNRDLTVNYQLARTAF